MNVDEPFEGTLTGYKSADSVELCSDKQKNMLESLKNAAPNAIVFTSIDIWDSDSNGSSTDTADETELNTLPELLNIIF